MVEMSKEIAGKIFSTREELGLEPLPDEEIERVKGLAAEARARRKKILPKDKHLLGPKFSDDVSVAPFPKRWEGTLFSRQNRFELGRDRKLNAFYAAIPVTSGVVDYYEYYSLTKDEFDRYSLDESSAVPFIEECRRREHDDLLLQKPGWNRGVPM